MHFYFISFIYNNVTHSFIHLFIHLLTLALLTVDGRNNDAPSQRLFAEADNDLNAVDDELDDQLMEDSANPFLPRNIFEPQLLMTAEEVQRALVEVNRTYTWFDDLLHTTTALQCFMVSRPTPEPDLIDLSENEEIQQPPPLAVAVSWVDQLVATFISL